MAAPNRIQRRRVKGWRLPDNTVCVSRPSEFGNPFFVAPKLAARRTGKHLRDCTDEELHACADAEEAVRMYKPMVRGDYADDVRKKLRGKNLACWCPLGEPCHADVLLEVANA